MDVANEQQITSEGGLTISGFLPQAPQGRVGLIHWLKEGMQALTDVQTRYARLLGRDRRLVGQERHELATALDAALNAFLKLRAELSAKPEFTCTYARYNFQMHVTIRQNRWEGMGQLGEHRVMRMSNFAEWVGNLRHERLSAFVKKLGEALQDGHLDETERNVLEDALDKLLFGFVLAREAIESGQLS